MSEDWRKRLRELLAELLQVVDPLISGDGRRRLHELMTDICRIADRRAIDDRNRKRLGELRVQITAILRRTIVDRKDKHFASLIREFHIVIDRLLIDARRTSLREKLADTLRPLDESAGDTAQREAPRQKPPKPEKIPRQIAAPVVRPPVQPPRPPAQQVVAPPRHPQGRLGSFILQGDAALNLVREQLKGVVFRGETVPASAISNDSRARLLHFLSSGARTLRSHPEPDDLGYIVGFDFGTSSCKVVFHQPGAGDLAYAMPVPWELRVEEAGRRQDHLWRTVIWFDATTGQFLPFPEAGAVPVEGFKTRLLQQDMSELLPGVTAAEVATAYLAFIFAYAIGHYKEAAPAGFRRDAHFARFHFGAPVASMEDSDCVEVFRQVTSAAMQVAARSDRLLLPEIRSALASVAPGEPVTARTPCLLFEELSAVVAGYRASPQHRTGPHVIVDIGASTLDIATFNVLPGSGHVPVFYTSVELLGSDAHTSATRMGLDDDLFTRACQAQTEQVLEITRTRRDPQFAVNSGVLKPMLFVGGGRLDPVYERIYAGYEKGLGAPRRTPLPGENLRYDRETDFSRLLLAWGLSQEDINLPRIKPPSQIEDWNSPSPRNPGSGFVSKDDC